MARRRVSRSWTHPHTCRRWRVRSTEVLCTAHTYDSDIGVSIDVAKMPRAMGPTGPRVVPQPPRRPPVAPPPKKNTHPDGWSPLNVFASTTIVRWTTERGDAPPELGSAMAKARCVTHLHPTPSCKLPSRKVLKQRTLRSDGHRVVALAFQGRASRSGRQIGC